MDCCYARQIADLFEESGLRVHLEMHERKITDESVIANFCDKLAQSKAFVPIFSSDSVRNRSIPQYNWENITSSMDMDYLLFDCRLAMELYYYRMIEFVFPVLIGEKLILDANDEGGNSNVQRRSTKSNLGLAKYNENKFRAATDDDAAEIRAQNLIHKLTE